MTLDQRFAVAMRGEQPWVSQDLRIWFEVMDEEIKVQLFADSQAMRFMRRDWLPTYLEQSERVVQSWIYDAMYIGWFGRAA